MYSLNQPLSKVFNNASKQTVSFEANHYKKTNKNIRSSILTGISLVLLEFPILGGSSCQALKTIKGENKKALQRLP